MKILWWFGGRGIIARVSTKAKIKTTPNIQILEEGTENQSNRKYSNKKVQFELPNKVKLERAMD